MFHIDIEPLQNGRDDPAELGVVADCSAKLRKLTHFAKDTCPEGISREAKKAKPAEFRAACEEGSREKAESSAFPLMPGHILASARKTLPEDGMTSTDFVWSKNGVDQQFDNLAPGSILAPDGFATVGSGPPTAIAGKFAAADRNMIRMVGDGQNPSVPTTAVELNSEIVRMVM